MERWPWVIVAAAMFVCSHKGGRHEMWDNPTYTLREGFIIWGRDFQGGIKACGVWRRVLQEKTESTYYLGSFVLNKYRWCMESSFLWINFWCVWCMPACMCVRGCMWSALICVGTCRGQGLTLDAVFHCSPPGEQSLSLNLELNISFRPSGQWVPGIHLCLLFSAGATISGHAGEDC